MHTYQPPVVRLLDYAECENTTVESWPDYISEFGFTEDHIPELLTLMQDEQLIYLDPEGGSPDLAEGISPELAIWAPIHAWRTLGQLRAPEFLDAAVSFLKAYEIDWAWEEFPDVILLMGPSFLDPLGAAIKAEASEDAAADILISGLRKIVRQFPEERDRSIALITDLLKDYEHNHKVVNASLISCLLDLKATEALEVMEAAFQSQRVDEFYVGTWAMAQIELGLKTKADFTEEELTPETPPFLAEMRANLEKFERMRKPDAFSLGLPIDPNALPSTKPPEFDDLLVSHKSLTEDGATKGFGGSQKSNKKSKKKKKRQA